MLLTKSIDVDLLSPDIVKPLLCNIKETIKYLESVVDYISESIISGEMSANGVTIATKKTRKITDAGIVFLRKIYGDEVMVTSLKSLKELDEIVTKEVFQELVDGNLIEIKETKMIKY